ncbi:MAG: hypothetical protein QY307_03180 [Acidimicrobiia bacterium]|nr:MAG: hypothetical protein QY307_03180 [Acidimicrobiia bacterium]
MRAADSVDAERASPTIDSYVGAFTTSPAWDEICAWPPDVFAVTNLVLDHTEAYRLAVSPPAGSRWPPESGWHEMVRVAAEEWRRAVSEGGTVPEPVAREWEVVTRHRGLSLESLRRGGAERVAVALITLHAMADEACSGLSGSDPGSGADSFEGRAWALLTGRGSLSRISPARVRITPKTHLALRGITIRSLSRYLALMYEAVDVSWHRIDPIVTAGEPSGPVADRRVMLLPWPLRVDARAFKPIETPVDMDRSAFGFFEFSPDTVLDVAYVERLLEEATAREGGVDAVILPEAALAESEVSLMEELLERRRVPFLVAGVRRPAPRGGLGGNHVHIGLLTDHGWQRYRQEKHHRWSIDRAQISQYRLSRSLDPARHWWEGIELPPRTLQIIDVGAGGTAAPLVCEDLARMDEVSDLLRRIGPSLVVAVLLDGPQLATRWPHRYASVITDETGSAVLTLSSFGMVRRSRPQGTRASRVVALWNDPSSGLHEITLGRGAGAILITVSAERRSAWTADGRRHDRHIPQQTLRRVTQLRVPARAR